MLSKANANKSVTTQEKNSLEVLQQSDYGAKELKEWIAKLTFRAYLFTIASICILVFTYLASAKIDRNNDDKIYVAPPFVIKDYVIEDNKEFEVHVSTNFPDIELHKKYSTIERAGTPVMVPDAMLSDDLKDFAVLTNLGYSTAIGGDDGIVVGFVPPFDNLNANNNPKIEIKVNDEPGIDDFVPVQKEPDIDLAKLQRLVIYPELARKAKIEGRVIVRILVGKDGKIRNKVIDISDNEMLNQAALDAIDKYGTVTPAIQNGEPITVWVSIPIQFRLR